MKQEIKLFIALGILFFLCFKAYSDNTKKAEGLNLDSILSVYNNKVDTLLAAITPPTDTTSGVLQKTDTTLFQTANTLTTSKDSIIQGSIADEAILSTLPPPSEIVVGKIPNEQYLVVVDTTETMQQFHARINQMCYDALNDSAVLKALAKTQKLDFNYSDSLLYGANPFLIDLVYMGYRFNDKWKMPNTNDYRTMYFGSNATGLNDYAKGETSKYLSDYVYELRRSGREQITRADVGIYASMFSKLPHPSTNRSTLITAKPLREVQFVEEMDLSEKISRKLNVQKPVAGPWTRKAKAMLQFSQNFVSNNWYQGGVSNMSTLGILTGQLNYDDKKRTQWENNGEWRVGFMSITDTAITKVTNRFLNTSDDILKINSKFGFKAAGNWYYSSQFEFSTQFFDNYTSIQSNVLKAKFLTPVRMNFGVGMDYKYEKIFSLMVAPLAYKYIYANDTTGTAGINPNTFGIETGKKSLREIGSSFTAQLNYSPFRELQVNSKLKFYTNYEKVEVDWEIVGNFIVNRFLTTRIMLNPRYDNTVIMAEGQKARIQFKELMSFGFSFNFD